MAVDGTLGAASASGATPAATSATPPAERHARFTLDVDPFVAVPHPVSRHSTLKEERQQLPDSSQATLAPYAELGSEPPPLASPSASDRDVEDVARPLPAAPSTELDSKPLSPVDIEHVQVDNDPREWSRRKKYWVTFIVSIGALTPTLAASIYNPAFQQLREQLNASETELALSLSLFILFQGGMPVFWSAVGEIVGRKPVYLIAQTIFIVGTIVCSRANSMPLLIVFRIIQACGSSAVLSLGAGTLADLYEVKERGRFMGYYYGVPLVGPGIGPLLGGALTQASSWRATFYFIAGLAGLQGIGFIVYPDTWRKERSLAYQIAIKQSVARELRAQEQAEAKRQRKLAKGLLSTDATPVPTRPASPTHAGAQQVEIEVEDAKVMGRRRWWIAGKRRSAPMRASGEFKISIRDVNPLRPAAAILSSPVNLFTVLSSSILFATQYVIAVTSAITFAEAPYNYNALKVGLVLVSFGGGNILGSVTGGIMSDRVLAVLKKRNGGVGKPEFRLRSMFPAMPVMVASIFAFAWTSQAKVFIAGPVICLFFAGFSIMVIYSSVLAYLVDANVGRSSSAVACNSLGRGLMAFLMSEICLPIRSGVGGDGGLYSIFGGLLVLASLSFVMLSYKGERWRAQNPWERKKKPAEEKETAEKAVA